ncbi:uracil-O(2)--methyltransferase [Diplogelasinospora grovesii]|uniref:tRNA (uracil-O(2)-)-methyltransferase n=1 Tax=Diplogelasinospora grovesii TaxID=303347 RepID=A0AAN6S5I0_9PEZI|nr:uracil-O(2)--methyltransferase [Diplogelasinospora grovesii]
MAFDAEELAVDSPPIVVQEGSKDGAAAWRPLFRHECSFDAAIFVDIMINLIKNPNINSSWLFRADILHDQGGTQPLTVPPAEVSASIPEFSGFQLQRCMIRKLIPRNTLRDAPLDQTCLIYDNSLPGDDPARRTLVVYLPHVASEAEVPFYHPKVRGIAFLHEWTCAKSSGSISISYLYFHESDRTAETKVTRTAFHLLAVIHKHGQGRVNGYKKRVHHDVVLPQARVQDRYTSLKQKYARGLIEKWAESTDPVKHVFEDLGIAAFLLELWADMYPQQNPFPGFVDIGCGNGLLVYILNQEGFRGWGFDARSRKSWAAYNTELQLPGTAQKEDSLRQLVLLPSSVTSGTDGFTAGQIHDGCFPSGTFIISNHADELTPWTPILATASDCPFIMIPCCSHNLTGERFRAPPPKDKTKSESAYSSLVAWASQIATDCGWEVEQEMLRIPSTRNTALLGRRRLTKSSAVDIETIVVRYGGTAGYAENVAKLVNRASGDH